MHLCIAHHSLVHVHHGALQGLGRQWGQWASLTNPSLLMPSYAFSQLFLISRPIPGIGQNFLYFLFALFWERELCLESGRSSQFSSRCTTRLVVGSFSPNDSPLLPFPCAGFCLVKLLSFWNGRGL